MSHDLTWLCMVIRIAQVPRVLTVVCGDPPTDCVLAAWTSHTAKSVKDIWKTIASMKYSVKSARYIYKSYYFYTLHTDFTNWIIIISHIVIVTRCLVCVLQNCEKRRTVRRTRTALNNVVSETSLPVTRYDTSFETMINTRQRAIDDIVQEALRQHGY